MYLRLDDIFPDGISGDGIFTALQTKDVPWQEDNINASLDLMYHGNHGQRIISPLVKKLLDTDNELSSANKAKLATAIFDIYSEKWSKLWATLSLEYNPIENYNMEEVETPAEVTHTITPAETTETITPAETTETLTPAETTETLTPAETTVDSKPAKITTQNEVSAFNSSDFVDDTRTTSQGDDDDKGTDSIKVDTAGSNKLEVDTAGSNKLEVDTAGSNKLEVDTAGSDVLTVQNERSLRRSGNIGLTTSQQMIQSERDLWMWNFFESVFTDLDYVLTLQIY